MPILELCQLRLKKGVSATDPVLLQTLSGIRSVLKTKSVFYHSIADTSIVFNLGLWPSLEAYDAFQASSEKDRVLGPQEALTDYQWSATIEIESMASLPLDAPCMTVTRAFLKDGNHPEEYFRKINGLKAPIEEETKPNPLLFGWTTDSKPGRMKWLMFVGWQSKQHHKDYAQMLRENHEQYAEFPTIPAHYAEGTIHMHTTNMERKQS